MGKKRVRKKKIVRQARQFTKPKFNLALKDLLLFAILFFVFFLLKSVVSNILWKNLFLLLMIIFGFLTIAFLLVFLIFLFAKWIKK